ncbi:uncharacterized protein RhoGAP71E isoform X3 [Planococcus citri]|uniref:uncharacterized protein RhoGAP71E isoform X3 n=1 Tax=Planococcus citri TaxID=170843 RepID=UPI0031F785DB
MFGLDKLYQYFVSLLLYTNKLLNGKDQGEGAVREMIRWGERMTRGAASLSSVMTSCRHSSGSSFNYIPEKVKFGVPLKHVCGDHIPGALLILILKLNREGPFKKDVFRAPGNQASVKELISFLQTGTILNIEHYSVYTVASVLKKFLSKIPGGIFGEEIEKELLRIAKETEDETERGQLIHDLFTSLPDPTQKLLTLIFGTLSAIAVNSINSKSYMNATALGVCVAPSFFVSCGDQSKVSLNDIESYKIAISLITFIIEHYADYDFFDAKHYEYYVNITGRPAKLSVADEMKHDDKDDSKDSNLDACARLSVSLEGSGVYETGESTLLGNGDRKDDMVEASFSASSLPQVYERQVERLKRRTNWFLKLDNNEDNENSNEGENLSVSSESLPKKGSLRSNSKSTKRSLRRRNTFRGSDRSDRSTTSIENLET